MAIKNGWVRIAAMQYAALHRQYMKLFPQTTVADFKCLCFAEIPAKVEEPTMADWLAAAAKVVREAESDAAHLDSLTEQFTFGF